ncbi:4a-hydroxytetrahydrobiopterin dehydratase [Streptomyces sp. NBC_01190]|uniref:4a-hydroxytetrahydrobiopterin dehydratase n=1 Tax=Streptomyces sp. NBC_01190 TaxID=2903767 RepID=UPI0038640BA1|nr:4a-hydroxytetrahydrobiopterin dehydratase [Streptomyces sp. NBC_01190]
MPSKPLSAAELDQALTELPDWTVSDGALTATFTADRADIPALYAAVATAEDTADHHADIRILYGTISFALTTHDAGGAITAKDTALATRVTDLAAAHHAQPSPA